eukprot:3472271-Pyramimonas_sp.AAC.1
MNREGISGEVVPRASATRRNCEEVPRESALRQYTVKEFQAGAAVVVHGVPTAQLESRNCIFNSVLVCLLM